MSLSAFFRRRVRGFRLVEVWAFAIAIGLGLGLYLLKTGAGGEAQDIVRMQRAIEKEEGAIRLLRAEVAYLEQPERISRLSSSLGLAPVSGERDIEPTHLALAAMTPIAPKPQAAPAAPPPASEPDLASAEAADPIAAESAELASAEAEQ